MNEARPRAARQESYRQERRSQVRALLLLAVAVLLELLWRARSLLLFHPGWWRL